MYQFSPIRTKEELLKTIEYVHFEGYKLCKNSFGKYFTNAENIGIFCHYDDEYEVLINIRKEITDESDNVKQKYFRLINPIVIPAKDDIPEQTYSYLYIRKPDPYRHQVGDIDFYPPEDEYQRLKTEMLAGRKVKGARVFDRSDLDMIELYDPDTDVLAYVSITTIAPSVKARLGL